MIEIKKEDTGYRIINSHYDCFLSLAHGGTCRKLLCGGRDTGLTREGCEYWVNKKEHYEQEYGACMGIKVSKTNNCIRVIVNSTLVSPQKLREETPAHGGEVTTRWHFDETPMIMTWSDMQPHFPPVEMDKYICFEPSRYKYLSGEYGDSMTIRRYPSSLASNYEQFFTSGNRVCLHNKKNVMDCTPFIAEMDSNIEHGVGYLTDSMFEIKPKWKKRGIGFPLTMRFKVAKI